MPEDAQAVAAWRTVLDELAERLVQAVDDARAGREPADPWSPPADLPALPASLRPDAERLLAAQGDLADHLRSARDAVRAELDGARSAPRFVAPTRTKQAAARYVDLQA